MDEDSVSYVADTENNRIQQFQADGTFIRSWGGTGNGSILVADSYNHRIQVFRSTPEQTITPILLLLLGGQ